MDIFDQLTLATSLVCWRVRSKLEAKFAHPSSPGSGELSWKRLKYGDHRNRRLILLLDELGYLPIDKRGADSLFQGVAARHEVGSIVITTSRPFREWGTLFDVDNTLATALIDRLMHLGEAIVVQGDSYRMKDKDPDSTEE